uniref:Uncharacterized protein n=1 Tax=Knipowitschia caucasica TaxID=637954 RepID=A0AAV2IXU7_KNICA
MRLQTPKSSSSAMWKTVCCKETCLTDAVVVTGGSLLSLPRAAVCPLLPEPAPGVSLCLCSACAQSVLSLCSVCAQSVLCLCSVCALSVLCLCSVCAQSVLSLCSVCASACAQSVPLPVLSLCLCLCSVCALSVLCLCSVCALSVLCLCSVCALSVLCLCSVCALSVLCLCSVCAQSVLSLCSVCAQSVLCLCSVCARTQGRAASTTAIIRILPLSIKPSFIGRGQCSSWRSGHAPLTDLEQKAL